MQDWNEQDNNQEVNQEYEQETIYINESQLPISGEEAVQEALRQKALAEEEARQRREAAEEARRLAEENRRQAEEWRAKQQAFQEEQQRIREEKKAARRRRLRGAAAALAIVLGLGALAFAYVNHQNARNTREELARLQAEITAYQQSVRSLPDVNRMPSGNAVDTAELTGGNQGGSQLTDVSAIVEETIRSVVSINTSKRVKVSTGFFGEREYVGTGAGSGVIIGDNGTELWIVTNAHVVDDATEIYVVLADDSEVAAYVKGSSEENDIAVLGVRLEELSESTKQSIRTAAFGDSTGLRLGEGVIAIGNAMGWGQSVTTGVVSALSRNVKFKDGTSMNLLQISAAINPGNSGGALLNGRGQLIGINNAKYSSEEVEGVGFAIPISSIMNVMEELSLMQPRQKVSEADMPYLGITFQNYPSGYLAFYNVPDGAVIHEIKAGSPAEAAGLQPYDVITAIEGHKVDSYQDLTEELQYYKGGTEIEVTYMRLNRGSYEEGRTKLTLGFKSNNPNP